MTYIYWAQIPSPFFSNLHFISFYPKQTPKQTSTSYCKMCEVSAACSLSTWNGYFA